MRGYSRRFFLHHLACTPALLAASPVFLKRRFIDLPAAPPPLSPSAPPLLTFDEILQLYHDETPPPNLQGKLQRLLATPFVSNRAWESESRPRMPASSSLGSSLRVAQWNIDRGLAFEAIRAALTDPQRLMAMADGSHPRMGLELRAHISVQLAILQAADVIVLNEVDWGVNRTRFRDVAGELAAALDMNYAYGVEFVEVDPRTMGLDSHHLNLDFPAACVLPGETRAEALQRLREALQPDPARYRGLHGTAIFSRYPLRNVRVIRFHTQGYDWYRDEKCSGITQRVESLFGRIAFAEPLTREVRRGGRMMVLADLEDPHLPTGRVTVVATHLEDVTAPVYRRRQMNELLAMIRNIPHPVIVAGDMNTTMQEGMPVSLARALKRRLGNPMFWTGEGAFELLAKITPWGWLYASADRLASLAYQANDPTAVNVPLLMENPEEKFFRLVEEFRFADGSCFDFRGDARRSANRRSGKLANSNERAEKGFIPTQEFTRTFGPLGQFKIDWILVRPGALNNPYDANQPYRFSPHYGRTLRELNHSLSGPISDHSPITADLPLDEV
jgi:endonuclease/exonuclease/phosphatase family metal-dependent hydrolase